MDYLRWGDITPLNDSDGKLQAAKLTVYSGEPEQYFTFITPEAYEAVKEYMDFRTSHGESISKSSWVLRDLFDVAKHSKGNATLPKQLKSSGLKRLIERALWAQGIRKQLEKGKRRHEFQTDHGFRKYFKTLAERHMKSLHVEILMGHSTGLADNYYRIPEDELLTEYLKAAPDLSISNAHFILDQGLVKNLEGNVTNIVTLLHRIAKGGTLKVEDLKKYFPTMIVEDQGCWAHVSVDID